MSDRRTARDEALIQAGMTLASELSLEAVLQRIVELARDVAGARYAALGVVGPDGVLEDFLTSGVTDEQRRAIGNLPQGKGILGVLIHDARPLRLRRIQDHERSVGFPPRHPSMTSFLGVPIAVRGQVFGNLYLTEKEGAEEFIEDDERAVVTLAAQAGVAIENARLHADLQRLAIVEERQRIAKELHDDIVQSLFAEGMALQAARAMTNDPAAIDARLEQAVENLDRVIRDLRNYVFGLRPGVAADVHLERALRDLAAGFEKGGTAVDVSIDPGAASLLAGRANDILQAAREALSNAVRHSGASRVTLFLEQEPEGITLVVTDDGEGFDVARAVGKGLGLSNLHERAASLGGELTVDSSPGRGTRVTIRIPG